MDGDEQRHGKDGAEDDLGAEDDRSDIAVVQKFEQMNIRQSRGYGPGRARIADPRTRSNA
jgi:hypothetical protein